MSSRETSRLHRSHSKRIESVGVLRHASRKRRPISRQVCLYSLALAAIQADAAYRPCFKTSGVQKRTRDASSRLRQLRMMYNVLDETSLYSSRGSNDTDSSAYRPGALAESEPALPYWAVEKDAVEARSATSRHLDVTGSTNGLNIRATFSLENDIPRLDDAESLSLSDVDSQPLLNGRSKEKANGVSNGVSMPTNRTNPPTPQPVSLEEEGVSPKKTEVSPVSSDTDEAQSGSLEVNDEAPSPATPNAEQQDQFPTFRSMWKHRDARSLEEGIRRETTRGKKANKLSSVLAKARGSVENPSRHFVSRTITGLILALAEEATDVDVEVHSRSDTPMWAKHVDTLRIQFSRLGFKPLRMGGMAKLVQNVTKTTEESVATVNTTSEEWTDIASADDAFDRIDVDKSGSLDRDEIAEALSAAALSRFEGLSKNTVEVVKNLAADLVKLYDFNGDGVVDRKEYQSMVDDMAALREAQEEEDREEYEKSAVPSGETEEGGWFSSARKLAGSFSTFIFRRSLNEEEIVDTDRSDIETNVGTKSGSLPASRLVLKMPTQDLVDVSDSAELESMTKTIGAITFSELKLDLRQLLFGAVPLVRQVTPGGPLILEPFTTTINGSFNREDILNSALLDAGLRRLVARALRRRVGSLRDLFEGALFYGRTWKTFSEAGPAVTIPKLTDIEFDDENRLIITGRARVRANPGAAEIENAFKVRTRIGIRQGGRRLRLVEPELALVAECPRTWEENVGILCNALNVKKPRRPKPLYAFFPIYSPFKVDDNDGFDLGEDNCINSIYIKDGALRFEMCAIIRPGRFLGSHYLAFSVPNRTFIVTMDRIKQGIRAARQAKKAAKALQQASERRRTRRRNLSALLDATEYPRYATNNRSGKRTRSPPKSFFSRFVDGYMQAERDEEIEKERVTSAVREFFAQQGSNASQKEES